MTDILAPMAASFLLMWMGSGVIAVLLYRLLRTLVLGLQPAQASALLLAWICAPALFALATTTLLFDAGYGLFVPAHCHAGECSAHAPSPGTGLSLLALAAALGIILARRLSLVAWRLLQGLRLQRILRLASSADSGFRRITHGSPAAFTIGWWHPVTYLADALLRQCSSADVAVILAHEQAHRQRRDNLRILLATWLSAPLPGRASRLLWRDLRLLCEQACDEHAALELGRIEVAATLLRVASLQLAAAPPCSHAFTQSGTEARIEALLHDTRPALSRLHLSLALLALLVLVTAAVAPLHHLLESTGSGSSLMVR